jgi:hypothetical protein
LLAEFVGLDATCHFASLNLTIPMAGICDKVAFGAETQP